MFYFSHFVFCHKGAKSQRFCKNMNFYKLSYNSKPKN
jgi:hypothetical protein